VNYNTMREHDNDYVLLLDEVNSIMWHSLNGMKKASKFRLEFIHKLAQIIDMAYCVIASDADIMAHTLKFIRDITTKPIVLHANEYKQILPQIVNIYEDKTDLINEMEREMRTAYNLMKLNMPVTRTFCCCSDRKGSFRTGNC